MRALVTGASGAIGQRLCLALTGAGVFVRAVTRANEVAGASEVVRRDFGTTGDWDALVGEIDVVYHLAAHVHVRRGSSAYDESIFRRINVDATVALASAAVDAGVRRFVFLSTVGVHGDETGDRPFREADPFRPVNAYTASKASAEIELYDRFRRSALEITVLRAPLVYGPSVKGSFNELVRLIRYRVPLPFANVRNSRSMIAIDNLVDAMVTCASAAEVANAPFLVSDIDISTPDLIRHVAAALRLRALLVGVPPRLLEVVAAAFGRSERIKPLLRSLRVDTSKFRTRAGWTPKVTLDHALSAISTSRPV